MNFKILGDVVNSSAGSTPTHLEFCRAPPATSFPMSADLIDFDDLIGFRETWLVSDQLLGL
jgi:hypothetical protein